MDLWTPELAQAALEEAGKAMLALPASHVFPAEYRTAWPEIVRVIREGDRPVDAVIRPAVQSARANAAMEARLDGAMRYRGRVTTRRLGAARMLVHPDRQSVV